MPNSHLADTIKTLLKTSLEQGSPARFKVISGSMTPFLQVGDWITVETARMDQIRIGDVIVAQRDADQLTHRVIAIRQNQLITKGDRAIRADPPIAAAAILGRVCARERAGQTLAFNQIGRYNQIIGIISLIESKITALHPKLRYPTRSLIFLIARIWA